MQRSNDKQKARIAIVAIVLFIVFDCTALTLNYWLSAKIEQEAVSINLAGRQRMLSQRSVKVLLQIDQAINKGADIGSELAELQLSFALFDTTLQAFDRGNQVLSGTNELIYLPPVQGVTARAVVHQTMVLWQPYRAHLQNFMASKPLDPLALQATLTIAEDCNLQILDLMNTLTTELENQTQQEAVEIRYYQAAAFSLALLNFFWAFWMVKRRIKAVRDDRNFLDEIIHKITASVLVLDRFNKVLKANQTAAVMFGYAPDELIDKPFDDLLFSNADRLEGRTKNGDHFAANCQRSSTIIDKQELQIVTVLDVTEQRLTEAHLTSLAYHDLLTHLPNRLRFNDLLALELAHSQRRNLHLAVMFVDLDHFKPVNDQYGHEVGDLLLQEVALRLRQSLRESDTVSRHGGDEFTIIVSDIETPETAEKISRVILENLARPFCIQDHQLHISCSVGISVFPQDGKSAEDLIKHADEAMYEAKKAGRNRCRFYSQS